MVIMQDAKDVIQTINHNRILLIIINGNCSLFFIDSYHKFSLTKGFRIFIAQTTSVSVILQVALFINFALNKKRNTSIIFLQIIASSQDESYFMSSLAD